MCTNNYSNKERFDEIITKIKWCSFFASQCILTIYYILYYILYINYKCEPNNYRITLTKIL